MFNIKCHTCRGGQRDERIFDDFGILHNTTEKIVRRRSARRDGAYQAVARISLLETA